MSDAARGRLRRYEQPTPEGLDREERETSEQRHGESSAARVPRWRLLWNRLQAKLHHAYPCRRCGYAYNCPDGECHS